MLSGLHRLRRSHTPPLSPTLLSSWFPHTQLPLVISAPMLGVSNGLLAAAVSKAGGLGVVPGGYDFAPGSAHLASLAAELKAARASLGLADRTLTPLPLAVGFIICHPSAARFAEAALPLLQEHSPQGVWLFAPDPGAEEAAAEEGSSGGAQTEIVELLRRSGFTVMIQVGTVEAARRAVQDGADVVVAQGSDAGGHQFARGAGVVSLVPEVRTLLDREFPGKEVVLVAAGGIVDGRGVAAAIALGAEAAVMGTRFILSRESSAPDFRRQLIKETVDGGASTIKSTFHDTVQGTKIWPGLYDGRALVGKSYQDHAAGVPIEENAQKFNEAKEAGDTSRMVTWAGTGVGLVDQDLPAGDIVREVREAAQKRIKEIQAFAA